MGATLLLKKTFDWTVFESRSNWGLFSGQHQREEGDSIKDNGNTYGNKFAIYETTGAQIFKFTQYLKENQCYWPKCRKPFEVPIVLLSN